MHVMFLVQLRETPFCWGQRVRGEECYPHCQKMTNGRAGKEYVSSLFVFLQNTLTMFGFAGFHKKFGFSGFFNNINRKT